MTRERQPMGSQFTLVAPVALVMLSALAACTAGSNDAGDGRPLDDATARIAITQAPSDVSCLRVSVAGARSVSRSFDVKQGQSTVFVLSGLPDGAATFLAEAFPQSCVYVGASSTADWVSDAVAVTLVRGRTVDVKLLMHGNAGAAVSIDFPDGGAAPDGGVKPSPSPSPAPFALGEPSFPSVQQGPAATARLSTDRQGLLDKLRLGSTGPVELIVDEKTGVVLSLDLALDNLPGQSSLRRRGHFWPAMPRCSIR